MNQSCLTMTRQVEKAEFAELVELAMSRTRLDRMRPMIQKELLNYDIPYSLDSGTIGSAGISGRHSAAAMSWCPGYSEALDFVGGFNRQQLESLKHCVKHYIGPRYDLHVSESSDLECDRENDELKSKNGKFRQRLTRGSVIFPDNASRLKSQTWMSVRERPGAVGLHCDFLPEGHGDPLVLEKTLDEVVADKLVSLANTTGCVRCRDVWDLHSLKRKGIETQAEWVLQKICDCWIGDYQQKPDWMLKRLPGIIEGNVLQRGTGAPCSN